jgi:sporulation protein YlmC with PRC-barrel domain
MRTIVVIAMSALPGVVLAQTDSNPSSDQQAPQTVQESPTSTPAGLAKIPEAAAANPQPFQQNHGGTSQENKTLYAVVGSPSLAPVDADKGLKTATVSDVAVQFSDVKPAYIMSSNLIGISVYNNQNESVGAIRDLVIDRNKLAAVIVNVGGFLGLGESYVSLDPSTIVLAQKDGAWRAYVDISRDNLKAAPKFTYPKKNDRTTKAASYQGAQ